MKYLNCYYAVEGEFQQVRNTMSQQGIRFDSDLKRLRASKNQFVIDCAAGDFWFQPRRQPYNILKKHLSKPELKLLKETASEQDAYQSQIGSLAAHELLAEAWVRGEKTIANLPKMNFDKLIALWKNCLDGVTQTKNKVKRYQARIIIVSINEEWSRRSKLKPEDEGYFKWPDTSASFGEGGLHTEGWLKEGMLQFLGYRVGITAGVKAQIRRQILHQVFASPLPPVFPPAYMSEWSNPNSAARLKK